VRESNEPIPVDEYSGECYHLYRLRGIKDGEFQMTDRPVLVLIDGFALIYRSYFAFAKRPLINSRGEDTGALFAFASTILKMLKEKNPDYAAVAMDSPGPTFRHELFPEYKATRAKMPDELREQLPKLRELIDALDLPVFEKQGFEADDIIGTVAEKAANQAGMEVMILTGDKDFLQLVDTKIKVLQPSARGSDLTLLDREAVPDRLGVYPEKVVDFLALTGDTSDNVPGVRGIGPKTAVKLLDRCGSVERLIEDPGSAGDPKTVSKLEEYRNDLLLSRDLVTIRRDVPIDIDFNRLKRPETESSRLKDLFIELEFSSLLREMKVEDTGPWWEYEIISTSEALATVVASLRKAKMMAVDTETTAPNPMEASLVGISLAWQPDKAYYFPLSHLDGSNLDLEEVRRVLGPLFADPDMGKVGQNIKYDRIVLENAGFELHGVTFDTMLASYLLDPGARMHGIDTLSMKYFNFRKIPTSDLLGTGKKQITMDRVPVKLAGRYAAEDAAVTWRLAEEIAPALEEAGLFELMESMELPLAGVLARMEKNGIKIDTGFLGGLSEEVSGQLDDLTERIHRMAGVEFNINSPKQLSQVLFETMGIKPVRRTKTGFSTDEAVLETLAARGVDIAQVLLEFRKLAKLRSTYIDALPRMVNRRTGRIHTSFNQTVTSTGRLSSSEPNLQNIPVRTPEGRKIRRAFIPGDHGSVLLSADYSQVELRLMAHLSGDETMIRAFREGEDIHRSTAAILFGGVDSNDIGEDERRIAKTVNFGVMYGMGEYGLSRRLGIPVREAAEFIDNYFARYPGIKSFVHSTLDAAGKDGYVSTLLGRKRFLPEIQSSNKQVREAAERAAVNMPIQGTAADIIKLAMIAIDQAIREKGLATRMLLQVHDELVFEVPEEEIELIGEIVDALMSGIYPLDVPLRVDIGWGSDWLKAH